MLINTAHAAADATYATGQTQAEVNMLNLLLLGIMVVFFILFFIMPQQKRFKQHREMIDALKKGDKVLTTSGFIATIEKIEEGSNEVVLDLGHGTKVSAYRSSIQSKIDPEDKVPMKDKPEDKSGAADKNDKKEAKEDKKGAK